MKALWEKIRNLVRVAEVSRSSADNQLDAVSQVNWMGKTTNAAMVYPYGMSGNAPQYASVLLMFPGASAQNPIGIPYFPENRFRGLKEGEVKFGNFIAKCYLFFQADGSVTMKSGKDGGTLRFENTSGDGYFELTEDGVFTVANASGSFELKSNGQFSANGGNLTVDP